MSEGLHTTPPGSLNAAPDGRSTSRFVTPDRVVLRGGVGPEQPVWDDCATYSAKWYRRFRDWHHAEFPDSDLSTRDNLDMLVEAAR